MKTTKTMMAKDATAAGFRSLTTPYRLPKQQAILDSVLVDMRRGRIVHALVKVNGGVEVWRKGYRAGDGPLSLYPSPLRGAREGKRN